MGVQLQAFRHRALSRAALDSGLVAPFKSYEFASKPARPSRVKLSTEKVEKVIGRTPVDIKSALSAIHKELSN